MMPFKYVVYREDKYYVSQCLNAEVSSFGSSVEEAIAQLTEAMKLYLADESERATFQTVEEAILGEGMVDAETLQFRPHHPGTDATRFRTGESNW